MTLGIASENQIRAASVEEIQARYSELNAMLTLRIGQMAESCTVSNTLVVYAAGFIHSPSNVTALLSLIDLPGLDEPTRWYGYEWDWGTDNQGTYPTGIVSLARSGTSFSTPLPKFSRPPTPAVGALTQMPVPWQVLQANLDAAIPTSRRTALLAWVAAVLHPDLFWNWLDFSYQNNPAKWGKLFQYSHSNLFGKKPFSMLRYESLLRRRFPEIINPYLEMVSDLRDQAQLAAANENPEEYARIEAVLASMGQSIEVASNEVVEHTPETVGLGQNTFSTNIVEFILDE